RRGERAHLLSGGLSFVPFLKKRNLKNFLHGQRIRAGQVFICTGGEQRFARSRARGLRPRSEKLFVV
ncbi:MAG: hypothetical protein ACI4LE_01300, partial [Faecalibacterium sp.]